MKIFKALIAMACLPFLMGASEPRLVPDVSQRQIDIIYSFTGAELLLFGAILYPGGRIPDKAFDIAVVLKGPAEPILLREKDKVAGIWMNRESAHFRSVPSFYAVAGTRPVADLVDRRTAAIYEIGIQNLQLSPASAEAADVQRRFEDGLIDLKRRAGLYGDNAGTVTVSEHVLYRARIAIPARVPVGNYTAETFLIDKGRVVAAATRTITIEKSGFERFVAAAAHDDAFAYGAFAVIISLVLGWAAGRLFQRLR